MALFRKNLRNIILVGLQKEAKLDQNRKKYGFNKIRDTILQNINLKMRLIYVFRG